MMTNLFSVFDLSSSLFNMSLNWMSTFVGLTMIPSTFWLMPSRHNIMWNNIMTTLHKEFKNLLGDNAHNGSTFIFISFLFILSLFWSETVPVSTFLKKTSLYLALAPNNNLKLEEKRSSAYLFFLAEMKSWLSFLSFSAINNKFWS